MLKSEQIKDELAQRYIELYRCMIGKNNMEQNMAE